MIEVALTWLPPSWVRMLPQALMLAATGITTPPPPELLVAPPEEALHPVAATATAATATAETIRRLDMEGRPSQIDELANEWPDNMRTASSGTHQLTANDKRCQSQ